MTGQSIIYQNAGLERRPAPGAAWSRADFFETGRRSAEEFKKALTRAGGHPPLAPNGEEMVWTPHSGWRPRPATSPTDARTARERFRDMERRQEEVAAMIPGTNAYRLARLHALEALWEEDRRARKRARRAWEEKHGG